MIRNLAIFIILCIFGVFAQRFIFVLLSAGETAETNFRDFAPTVGVLVDPNRIQPYCQAWDNDGNNYISCTSATQDGRVITLECPFFYTGAACRVPKLYAQ